MNLDSGRHCYTGTHPNLHEDHSAILLSIRPYLNISCGLDRFCRHWPNHHCRHLRDLSFCLSGRWSTCTAFETVFDLTFVKRRRGVTKERRSVWFILTKFSLEICSIAIKDLAISLLHPVSEGTNKPIPIAVDDFCMPVQDPSLPHSIYPYFSRKHIVCPSAVPQILLPLALINLLG